MSRLLNVVLLLIVAGLGFLAWEGWHRMQSSQQETAALQLQVDALRQELQSMRGQVAHLEEKVSQLDKTSVDKIVRQANSAILDGWQSLMSTVEGELKRAREALSPEEKSPPASDEPAAGRAEPDPALWPEDAE